MTLPATRRDPYPLPEEGRSRAAERALAEKLRERIALAERAARAAAETAEARVKPPQPKQDDNLRGFGIALLVWSCLALIASIGILAYETFGASSAAQAAALRPALTFADVSTRYVQSAEGPALELTGVVRNSGETSVLPEVRLQIAGEKVAIEENLRLGGAKLQPEAERPFAVRLLLPEGVSSISLLPPTADGQTVRQPSMTLVSPAWTADAPGY
ncbi:MAG: hypothetical protein AAF830_14785 [Pseudomonadota bacterium]